MLADQLSNVGSPVSDHRLVLQLIAGLNESYDNVATLIQQSDPPLFYEARSKLCLEETRKAEQAKTAAATALAASSSSETSQKSAMSSGNSNQQRLISNNNNRGGRGGGYRGGRGNTVVVDTLAEEGVGETTVTTGIHRTTTTITGLPLVILMGQNNKIGLRFHHGPGHHNGLFLLVHIQRHHALGPIILMDPRVYLVQDHNSHMQLLLLRPVTTLLQISKVLFIP